MSDGNEERPGVSREEKYNPEVHETAFLNTRTLVIALSVFILLIVVALAGAWILFQIYPASSPLQATPVSLVGGTITPPGPQLQANPEADLQNYQSTQQAILSSYGYVDKNAGIVHMPVDQAMQIYIQKGMPTFPPAPTSSAPTQVASSPAAEGEQLFTSLGCVACHTTGVGPNLKGVYGSQVQLQGGGTVVADDAYIRESILQPQAKIVQGYGPIMPSFQGKVTDAQINALIAYIKSLSGK